MRRKQFTDCWACEDGQVFSSYSAYGDSGVVFDHWTDCKVCRGTGETWRYIPGNIAWMVKMFFLNLRYKLFPRYDDEEDIPF